MKQVLLRSLFLVTLLTLLAANTQPALACGNPPPSPPPVWVRILGRNKAKIIVHNYTTFGVGTNQFCACALTHSGVIISSIDRVRFVVAGTNRLVKNFNFQPNANTTMDFNNRHPSPNWQGFFSRVRAPIPKGTPLDLQFFVTTGGGAMPSEIQGSLQLSFIGTGEADADGFLTGGHLAIQEPGKTMPQDPIGNFLYTNDNPGGPNTVSGYSVAENGSLTPVAGSPFATGGMGEGGGFFASGRITVCAVGNFLYVSNSGSNNVSGFSIDPGTGVITPVVGSPFPTGGISGGLGISLAATPDGSFLIAGHGGSQNLRVFAKNPDGSLTPVGLLVPAGGLVDGMKVTPDGSFFLAVLVDVGPHGSVAVLSISDSGGLTPVPGSPFSVRGPGGPDGVATGVDANDATDTVSVGEATFGTTIVDVLSLDPNGGLTPIPGSPFTPPVGQNSNVPLLSLDNANLFVSNQLSNSITAFSVDPNDSHLTLVGSFPAGGAGDQLPAGMATDQAGTLLYTAKFTNFVSVFTIASDGSLTLAPGSPVNTGQPPGLLALTAFPPE